MYGFLMASNNRIKALRIFFGVIIALMVLGLVAAFGCGWYVKKHLPQWVLQATDSAYHANADNVSVNLFTGKITGTGLELLPDTARLLKLSKSGQPQKVAVTLHIPKLQIDGFACMRLARKHELSCEDIIIWQPNVLIKPVPLSDVPEQKRKKEGAIKGIFINKVYILRPNVMYRANDQDDDSIICHLYGGKAELKELQLIPGKPDTSRILLARKLIIDSSAFSFDKKKALYTVRVPAFYANTEKEQLQLDGFVIRPLYNHEEFYKKIGHRMTICDIYVATAKLTKLDWQRLLHDHHEVSVAKIQLTSPVINLFFDYRQPSRKGNVVDKDPYNILRKLGVKLNAQDVAIDDGHLAYTEVSDESKRQATILFEQIKGYAKNVTNIQGDIQKDNTCVVALHGTFMHGSDMNAMLHLNLADTLGGYTIEGHMKGGDAAELNEVARNLAQIQLDSLHLTGMDAELHGNQNYVDGKLNVSYEHLYAKLLKPVPVDSLKEKKLASFIANELFVYHDNPKPGGKRRSASTQQARDPEVPFIATLVKNIKHNGRKIIIKDEPVVDVVTGDTKDLPPVLQKKAGFFKRLFGKKK